MFKELNTFIHILKLQNYLFKPNFMNFLKLVTMKLQFNIDLTDVYWVWQNKLNIEYENEPPMTVDMTNREVRIII